VHTASTATRPLERAAALHPDIVLPPTSACAAVRLRSPRARIRAEAWGKDALLVGLNRWGQDQDRRRSAESGFDRHLIKPITAQALQELFDGPRAHVARRAGAADRPLIH